MCGIFGIIGSYDPARARKALKKLNHRGGDGCGIYETPTLFLGHQRLYILDPNTFQPFKRGERIVVFNGEIYNYKAFGAANDTEAVALGFEAPSELDGMFAFGVSEPGSFVLVRDLFGKKPLFYYKDAKRFLFSSEIKAIVEYLGGVKPRKESLTCYLSFGFVPGSRTMYEGIYKLLPGQKLILDTTTLESSLQHFATIQKKSGNLEEALIEAVRKRLQGDFEVAALLSGGVDSSFVSALAKRYQGSLRTYAIGYEEHRYSELSYAKRVAAHIGSEHTEVVMGRDDFYETLMQVVDHFDEPVGDSATIPLWYLFSHIKERIVLSGEGGDEIFLGYPQYFEFLDLFRAKDLKYKNWLKNYFRAHFSPNREWEWYKRVFSGEIVFRSTAEVFTDLQKNIFMKQNVKDGESVECLDEILDEWKRIGLKKDEDFFTFLDLRVRLGLYLHKLDHVSMAFGKEARTPLLDTEVLMRALAHPDRAKEPKYLLKTIAKGWVPDEVLQRKKRGFSYPYMEWMDERICDTMLRINERAAILHPKELEFLIQNAKRKKFLRHFWIVLAFLLWIEKKF